MTVLDDRQSVEWAAAYGRPATGDDSGVHSRSNRPALHRSSHPDARRSRPAVVPLRYHGNGVRMSQAVHTRRPVSTAASLGLAGLAAMITLWLGLLANLSGERVAAVEQSDRLAVVQVQAGETLQQLAARVAPNTPTGQVVARIRELNQLDSAAVDAGQTLIAPIG